MYLCVFFFLLVIDFLFLNLMLRKDTWNNFYHFKSVEACFVTCHIIYLRKYFMTPLWNVLDCGKTIGQASRAWISILARLLPSREVLGRAFFLSEPQLPCL